MPTRADFEAWFRSFHPEVPVVHQGPSSALDPGELGFERFRFVHVDGSHTYEAVVQDIATACEIVTEGGVVAFDDFANVGHPAVAAALWPALVERDLEPFACSPSKLYVTSSRDRAPGYRAAIDALATQRAYESKVSEMPDGTIVQASGRPVSGDLSLRELAGRVRRSIRRNFA